MPNKTKVSAFFTATIATLLSTMANANPAPQDNDEGPWIVKATNTSADADWGFPGLWPGVIFSAITVLTSAVYIAKNFSKKKREGNWVFGGSVLFGSAALIICVFEVWSYSIASNKDDPNDNPAYETMSIVQLVLMVLTLTGITSKTFEGRQCCTKVGGNPNERRNAGEEAPLLITDAASRGSTTYGAPARQDSTAIPHDARQEMQNKNDQLQKQLDEQRTKTQIETEAKHKAELAAKDAQLLAVTNQRDNTLAFARMQFGWRENAAEQPRLSINGGGATEQLAIEGGNLMPALLGNSSMDV
jgi:hypothetical protein